MIKYYAHTVQIHGSEVQQVVFVADDRVPRFMPNDPANTDYQQYLEWVAEGNTPEPWQPDSES